MARRHENGDSAPGQDSFLDVVANLVGILIILIMVLGVRAKEAYIEAAPETPAPEVPTPGEVASLTATAENLERDVNDIAAKIQRHDFELAYRQKERDKILVVLTAAEKAVDAEKSQLDASSRQRLDLQQEVSAMQLKLGDLRAARDAAENATSVTAVIEHLPTPMAKTVFGKEIHFRLMGGRLTYIPWNDLVEKLKDEAQQKLWKLKDMPEITEDAGPIGGFRIRYTLRQFDITQATKVGTMVQRRIELDRFELAPVAENLGEPFEQALQPNSALQGHLADADPRNTTITVWVYPDSFDQFRTLKQELYRRGFLTAARPLPEGRLIGGSPRGSRSAAQ